MDLRHNREWEKEHRRLTSQYLRKALSNRRRRLFASMDDYVFLVARCKAKATETLLSEGR